MMSRAVAVAAVLCLMLAACGGGALPQSEPRVVDGAVTPASDPESPATAAATEEPVGAAPTAAPTEPSDASSDGSPTSAGDDGTLIVDVSGPATPIDRRVLGTNLPAWIRPSILVDPAFQQAVTDSGTTLIRMPGGSWSNVYDWLGCEQVDSDRCFWTWASRPTDFVNFMAATGLNGMWTVSINETAQKSAAVVAFFNGDVDDTTVIGVDRDGVDWGEVGDWAQLRAANGNPEPAGIMLWEVGNEVFGGRPSDGGEQCAGFGWEEVWTCDGTEYVAGVDGHDGALAIREAMLAVDPNIEVGLVGVSDAGSWSNWGNEIFAAAGDALDIYVVHEYGFQGSPSPEEALARPAELWPDVIANSRRGLPSGATLAITEYNLVSFEAGDTSQTMRQAMNAFFLADTIGQFAANEVAIATWWNLANGVTGSGTDYGLISVEDGDNFRRAPTFQAFALWGRTGTSLLDVPDRTDDLRVYPTRHADGRVTIVAINLGADAISTDLVIDGLDDAAGLETTIESFTADDLNSQSVTVVPQQSLGAPSAPIALDLLPWSMSLIEVRPAAS